MRALSSEQHVGSARARSSGRRCTGGANEHIALSVTVDVAEPGQCSAHIPITAAIADRHNTPVDAIEAHGVCRGVAEDDVRGAASAGAGRADEDVGLAVAVEVASRSDRDRVHAAREPVDLEAGGSYLI